MQIFDSARTDVWKSMVGQKVWKNSKTNSTTQPKPFKSGLKVNTIRGYVDSVPYGHGYPGFTFEEDDSVVECFRCSIAPIPFQPHDIGPRGI